MDELSHSSSDPSKPRAMGTNWTPRPRPCDGCGQRFQALCVMTDHTELCLKCQYPERR